MKNTMEYKDFYNVAGVYGNNPVMKDRLATKWLSRYNKLNEGNKIMFWLILDKTEDVHIADRKSVV